MLINDWFNIRVFEEPTNIIGGDCDVKEMLELKVTIPKDVKYLMPHWYETYDLKVKHKMCVEYINRLTEVSNSIDRELRRREREREDAKCGIDWFE